MIKIVKKKINISDELKSKIKWSCKFSNRPYQVIKSCLLIVEHTKIAYMEPHKVIIDDKLYLFFNDQTYFSLYNEIKKIIVLIFKVNSKALKW